MLKSNVGPDDRFIALVDEERTGPLSRVHQSQVSGRCAMDVV